MDLYVIPLRLKLSAFAQLYIKLGFFSFKLTLFRGNIWSFSLPAIRKRILTIETKGNDDTPPTFDDNGKKISSSRNRRDASNGCELYQIPGRNPNDTAFMLKATANDDITETKLSFKIGTSQAASDVKDWTEMGGSVLMYAVKLPNGIPLYWTLRARNDQGMESFTECMIHTYDNTVPYGRVDPSFELSSHPHVLSATVSSFDDSVLMDTILVAVGYSPGLYGSEVVAWQN